MTPNFDGLGDDRGKIGEKRNLDPKFTKLFHLHGSKSWIFTGRAGRAPDNRFSQRVLRFHDTNAALQPVPDVKGHENASALSEDSIMRDMIRKLLVGNCFNHGRSRELQRRTPLRFREGRHPATSCAPRAYGAAGVA